MIKNEREYRITRAQAEKFAQALAQMEEEPREAAGVHPLLRKAEADALQSQMENLRAEIAAYTGR